MAHVNEIGPPPAVAASTAHAAAEGIRHLGDFTTGPRVLVISAIALVVGTGGVIAGVILLNLIRLVHQSRLFRPLHAWPTCSLAIAARRSPPWWCR